MTDARAEDFAAYQDRVRTTLIERCRVNGYDRSELDQVLEDLGLQPVNQLYTVQVTRTQTLTYAVRAASQEEADRHIRDNIPNRSRELGNPVNYDAPSRNETSITVTH